MKFVISLAFAPLEQYTRLAVAADAAGFDSLALSDHVVHPQRLDTPYPYTADGAPRWQPGTPWPDPWVAIAAMAAVTERLRFVTSIYVLPMRNPFLVAKAVATAAVLSGDRVSLGVGVGWMREEFELLGQPFAGRGRRTDEMIDVLRSLWRGGFVEHHGVFYDFAPLEMSPAPGVPVPIYVGGLSEPALRRAAVLADGWISDLHTSEELKAIIARLRSYRADSPRRDEPLAVWAACSDAFDLDGYRRLEALGVTHCMTQPWLFYGGPSEDPGQRCEGIERFGEDVIAALA